MLSLNQEIAKRIHNAQLDNEGDISAKGIAKGIGLGILDGAVDGLIIAGVINFAIGAVNITKHLFKKKKG